MNTLAIDSSSSIMSVSLEKGNSLFESSIQDGFKNSENLMPLIDSLFKTARFDIKDLDLIAVSSGPGSFTGLRIAMSTAKGISMGSEAPLISVPTLDAYAFGYDFFDGAVVPVIDARKKRFYCSFFVKGEKKSEDLDISPDALLEKLSVYKKILFTGPDCYLFSSYKEKNSDLYKDRIYIDKGFTSTASSAILKLGKEKYLLKGPDPKGSGPVYIRKSEAEISLLGE